MRTLLRIIILDMVLSAFVNVHAAEPSKAGQPTSALKPTVRRDYKELSEVRTSLPNYKGGSRSKRLSLADPAAKKAVKQLQNALEVLKARDLDPTAAEKVSFFALAAIHGYPVELKTQDHLLPETGGKFDQVWGQCPHEGDDKPNLFLLWHRAYVMAFEATIQSVLVNDLKDPDGMQFRLPYWDWYENQKLPEQFRKEKVTSRPNPLYVEARAAAIQSGTDVVLFPGNDVNPFLLGDGRPFEAFNSGLRDSWHSAVHGAGVIAQKSGDAPSVRPWMASSATAAFDPVFWVHHANVDRLFQHWLEKNRKIAQSDAPRFEEAWKGAAHVFLVEVNGKAVWWKPDFSQLAFGVASPINGQFPREGKFVWPSYKEPPFDAWPQLPKLSKAEAIERRGEAAFKNCSPNYSKTIEWSPKLEVRRDGVKVRFELTDFEWQQISKWASNTADGEYASVYLELANLAAGEQLETAYSFRVYIAANEAKIGVFEQHYVGAISQFTAIPMLSTEKAGHDHAGHSSKLLPIQRNLLNRLIGQTKEQHELSVYVVPYFRASTDYSWPGEKGVLLRADTLRLVVRARVGVGKPAPEWCTEDES